MNPSGQPFGAPPAQPRNDQLNLAAILLMVSAAFAIIYGLMSMLSAGSDGSWIVNLLPDEATKQKMREALAQGKAGGGVASMVWPLVIIAANGFIIFAATKMKNAQNHSMSMAAAILATIPCCFNGCCCVLSMPAGIFALVVLMKPEVKSSFT